MSNLSAKSFCIITIIITLTTQTTTASQIFDCFVGEIITATFNFAPPGTMLCDGSLLSIAQNTALFSLLGTTYGGDGKSNYALPDLRDRVPIHYGQGPGLSNRDLGESGGYDDVSLTVSQIPSHTHHTAANSAYNTCERSTLDTGNCTSGQTPCLVVDTGVCGDNRYRPTVESLSAGNSSPHNNIMPTAYLNFFICVQGVFPPRGRSVLDRAEEYQNDENNNDDEELGLNQQQQNQKRSASSPYIGEIMIFAGNFAPVGWITLDGQLVNINENENLFQLIGTTYGGDGQETFALPDLRGRVALHQGYLSGTTYVLGELGGVEDVTLTVNQIPSHSHQYNPPVVTNDNPSMCKRYQVFRAATQCPALISVDSTSFSTASDYVGGSQPHTNMQPYLGLNFQISLYGIFPSPTKRSDVDAEYNDEEVLHENTQRETSPVLGEIKLVTFNFAPKGWAFCNGQLLPINQNQALFSILGTTYGGNGQTTFALPDLRGRTAGSMGSVHTLGERNGEETHTLSLDELATHTSTLTTTNNVKTTGTRTPYTGCPSATTPIFESLSACSKNVTFIGENSPANTVGGGQPHPNLQPYLVLNYIIALQGIFPSPN